MLDPAAGDPPRSFPSARSGLPMKSLVLLAAAARLMMASHLAPNETAFPDEDHRPAGKTRCAPEEFPCGNTSVCLDRLLHCDGVAQCENGQDESKCDDSYGSLLSLLKKLEGDPTSLEEPQLQILTEQNCSGRSLPDGCECRFLIHVHCQTRRLTQIPKGLSQEITKLVVSNGSISILDAGSFRDYKNLRVLHLGHNGIQRIVPSAFAGLTELKFLIMDGNELTTLDDDVFLDMDKLQWLQMRENQIKEFNPEAFRKLHSLQMLDLTGNAIHFSPSTVFPLLEHLYWLELGRNQIQRIERDTFAALSSLEVLVLKDNVIEEIDEEAFWNLSNLAELDLSCNRLSSLKQGVFRFLKNLNKLGLARNPLTTLPENLFGDLSALKSLDLTGIEIDNINIRHFQSLFQLDFIYFKRFRYCSYAPYVRICKPKTDGLSSTEHLLVWPVLRMSVWIVAFVTCAGNTVVLVWRILSRKEDRVLSLFIRNLSAADLMMGVYLLAIGAQDSAFRDEYNKHAHAWMSSWQCTACGILAMISCEVSVLILSLITIERYRCIKSNIRVVTVTAARINVLFVWLAGVLLAVYPVIHWSHERTFYSSNGLCFPLHIDDPYMFGWEYSAFVFLGVNFTAMALIILLYTRMFMIVKEDRRRARPVILKKREDAVLALRFFFIVLTDCLCWIPIVAIKIVALSEITVSEKLHAWVVVFILPINSALNPVIYTLAAPTELRRRIHKLVERALVCHQRLECLIISDTKSPPSSVITGTEARSLSNGSILGSGVTSPQSGSRHQSHDGEADGLPSISNETEV